MLSALICQAKVKGAGHSPWACQPRTFPLLSECLGRFPHKACLLYTSDAADE